MQLNYLGLFRAESSTDIVIRMVPDLPIPDMIKV